jgi:hypothetical protein
MMISGPRLDRSAFFSFHNGGRGGRGGRGGSRAAGSGTATTTTSTRTITATTTTTTTAGWFRRASLLLPVTWTSFWLLMVRQSRTVLTVTPSSSRQ